MFSHDWFSRFWRIKNSHSSVTGFPTAAITGFIAFFHGHIDQWIYTPESESESRNSEHKVKKISSAFFIKKIVVCGPGLYYGGRASTRPQSSYCPEGIENCVPCPGDKVKFVPGNRRHLCVDADDACDGTKTVLNNDRSGCGMFSSILP